VKTKILLALSLLIVGVAARANTSPVTAIADANNRFCLDLYRQMQGTPGNLAFSPYSISSALAMTYAGARGRTEEEMARVLHLLFGQDSTHAAAAALRKALLASSSAAGCTLSVANRLWGQDGFQYLEPFLKTTRDAYGAELERLDFSASHQRLDSGADPGQDTGPASGEPELGPGAPGPEQCNLLQGNVAEEVP
jgi:serpin B